MPLNLPDLDDRSYADLMEEALTLIPAYAPEWTNHNPSDPGITLIELFAYLTEMLIYRLNRVTDANKRAFLNLLNKPEWQFDETKTLNQNIQDTVLSLRDEQRAVTVEDFERLARAADNNVARAYCLPRRNLESGQSDAATREEAGHISVVIIPWPSNPIQKPPFEPGQDLIRKVRQDESKGLKQRCLITTRLHVVGPRYLKIGVRVKIRINADVLEQDVRKITLDELHAYFHPLTGGTQGTGWPLGRNVYVSDIYALLDKLPGVDFVEKSSKSGKPLEELVPENTDRRLLSEQSKQLVGVWLEPNELVDFQIITTDIQIVRDTKHNRNRIQD